MIALIDADILVYRVGFTTQTVDAGIACARMNESIEGILLSLNTEDYIPFITTQEKNNFRYQIYPEYKAKRLHEKPLHYGLLREHIVNAHKGVVCELEEADDRIGIMHYQNWLGTPQITCICSIDKDLNQLPGWHFNFVKGLKYYIEPLEGTRFFYIQLLTGDLPTDNIPGIYGIGPKKAEKALKDCTNETEMFNVVKQIYKQTYPETWESIMLRNGQLLKIRTREGELWQFPDESLANQGTEAV